MATPQTRASPPHGTLAQQAARALLVFAFIALTTASGLAQTRDTPIPPRRPASLAQDPTPAPTLAPPPAPAPAAAPGPRDAEPPRLPQASRERMRECGLKWEAMKRAGKEGTLTWRSFAMKCLVGK